MRLIGVISAAVLSLAIAVPAYAQQEQHDQQEEQKAKPAQDEKKAQPEKPQQGDKNAKQEDKNTQQENKNKNQEEKSAQQPEKNNQQEQKNAQQENKNTQQENRNAQQGSQQADRGNGGRIPAERYQANFGRQHTFRVTQGDYSNHRFEYGGYSFAFVDAWPSNWLYTQDLYVIDINGVYYLCNPMYPGINVALSVTL